MSKSSVRVSGAPTRISMFPREGPARPGAIRGGEGRRRIAPLPIAEPPPRYALRAASLSPYRSLCSRVALFGGATIIAELCFVSVKHGSKKDLRISSAGRVCSIVAIAAPLRLRLSPPPARLLSPQHQVTPHGTRRYSADPRRRVPCAVWFALSPQTGLRWFTAQVNPQGHPPSLFFSLLLTRGGGKTDSPQPG